MPSPATEGDFAANLFAVTAAKELSTAKFGASEDTWERRSLPERWRISFSRRRHWTTPGAGGPKGQRQ